MELWVKVSSTGPLILVLVQDEDDIVNLAVVKSPVFIKLQNIFVVIEILLLTLDSLSLSFFEFDTTGESIHVLGKTFVLDPFPSSLS